MSSHPSYKLIRIWSLPAITALATILVAAASEIESGWARLRALPAERRLKLVDTLKKFDLVYSREQQQALRDLDRRINELPAAERNEYFSVLHRYHNWLNQLPENKQSDVNDKPPGERMAVVNKLIADFPVPRAMTSRFLQVADLGDHSPLELAAIFKIWQAMPAARRREIEGMHVVPKRLDALFKFAEKKELPREIKPPALEETEWIAKLEDFLRVELKRPMLLNLDMKKKQETVALRSEIMRRMAINYHFMAHPPPAVTPERLDDFVAAFPPWLKSTFDPFPPDEARRRLTVVYRLIYPHPEEMKVVDRPAAARGAARQGSNPPAAPAGTAGKPQTAPGASPF
jgi:hypothetical protein